MDVLEMAQNTPPCEQLEILRQMLVDLQFVPRRVQVRALLPMIDALMKQGFGIAFLAQELGEGGVPFKPSSLKQAIYLWRKKRDSVVVSRTESHLIQQPFSSNGVVPKAWNELFDSPSVEAAKGQLDRQQLTKADLKRIREGHIDLEQIVRQARGQKSTG